MQKSFSLVIALLSTSFAWAQQQQACDSAWKEIRPLVQNLKSTHACGSQYSTSDCRENLGLAGAAGAAALAGGSVGAMAGRSVSLKPLEVCMRPLKTSAFFFESVSWASGCLPSTYQDAADSVKSALTHSNAVREAELGKYLTDKVAQDNPALDELAKKMPGVFTKSPDLSLQDKLKELNQTAKSLGIPVTVNGLGTCAEDYSNPKSRELCDKLWSLAYSKLNGYQGERLTANADRLAKYYANDENVQNSKRAIDKANTLLKRISTGLVKDDKAVIDLFEQASKVTHDSSKGVLSAAALRISSQLPAFASSAAAKNAEALAKVSAEYIKKNSGVLKKILPGPILAMIGLAKGASAGELIEDATPMVLQPFIKINGACSTTSSQYAPIDPHSQSCEPLISMTPEMTDYLLLPEEKQKQEFCQYKSLETVIRKLNAQYYPPNMSLTCKGSQVDISSDFKDSKFFGQFEFSGEELSRARVTKKLEGLTGYDFQLDLKSGQVSDGKLINSRSYQPLKKGTDPSLVSQASQDFYSSRRVLAVLGKDCCSSGSSESCSAFKAGVKGSTTTPASSSSNTTK